MNISQGINTFFKIFLVGVLAILLFIGYLIYLPLNYFFGEKTIKTTEKIEPTYEIKESDTTYIYTFKNRR